MKLPRNLGMVLLAIWVIAQGALPILGVSPGYTGALVLHALAIAAGILLLMGR